METVISMVRQFLGEDVKTTDLELGHDWHAELAGRWKGLGERVFVRKPQRPPGLSEIIHECAVLAVAWALAESQGNLSHAAAWIGSDRRSIRLRLHQWLESNPKLIPMPAVVFLNWSKGKGGKR